MQQRMEPREQGAAILVWDYRLERKDEAGKPLPRVPVEMRGTSFDGGINNGDWIEIDASWTAGTTVRPQTVRNLTTNATVTASGAAAIHQQPTPSPGCTAPSTADAAVGQARRVQQRAQLIRGGTIVFLDFRLERADGPPLSVAMKGSFFSGSISEGDCVQVPTRRTAGGAVQTDRVFNLTTGSEVTMSRGFPAAWEASRVSIGRRATIAVAGLGLVLTLVAAGFLVVVAVTLLSGGQPPFDPVGPSRGAQVAVPDVRGMDGAEAARTLSDAGFSPQGTTDTSPDIQFGYVIRTDPPAGSQARRGSSVTFVVSTGPPR